MSLQVWLPLNGNINNQGLYKLPAPVFNQFIYDDGKTGQKSARKRIGWHLEEEILGNQWSVMTWICLKDYSFAAESQNLIFCKNISSSTDCQIYFSILPNATGLNIGVNGPARSLKYDYTFTTNTWYHVGATYDGNIVSLYLNGERVASTTVTTAYPEGRLNMQLGGRSQNINGTNTYEVCNYNFNDFRLYNHALSKKEVKEISKGLILHYKLDNNGMGNTNLAPESQRLSDDLYSSWEIDSSGYNNHGTKKTTFNYIADTKRYNTATVFARDAMKKILTPILPTAGLANSYTIAWWAKTDDFLQRMFWGFTDGNRLNYFSGYLCNTEDGENNPFQVEEIPINPPTVNVWHHYAMTGNGEQVKLYIDGELSGIAKTYKPITGSQINLNSWDNNDLEYTFDGLMSDFRIYTTTLDDESIKELYNIPIVIDKNSNIYGAIYTEEMLPSFDRTGTIKHNNFIEDFGVNRVEEEMWGKSYSYIPIPGDNKCITPIVVDMTQYKTGTKIYVQADIEWSGFEAIDADGQALKVNFQGDNYIPEKEGFGWDYPNPQPIAIALRQAVNNDLTAVVLSAPQGKKTLFGSYTVTSEVYPTIWPKARLGIRTNYSNGTASFTLSNVKVMFETDYTDGKFKINNESLITSQFYEV